MFARLFPRSLTNDYRGSWIAVWLLMPVLIVKTLIGFNFSGLNPFIDVSEILQTVDGVPLDSFSQEAATAVVDSAGAWGVALFSLCAVVWLVVVRYRAGLPLAIGALLFEQIGRTGVDAVRVVGEIVRAPSMPAAGAIINLTMMALLVLALLLSLAPVRPLTPGADGK